MRHRSYGGVRGRSCEAPTRSAPGMVACTPVFPSSEHRKSKPARTPRLRFIRRKFENVYVFNFCIPQIEIEVFLGLLILF